MNNIDLLMLSSFTLQANISYPRKSGQKKPQNKNRKSLFATMASATSLSLFTPLFSPPSCVYKNAPKFLSIPKLPLKTTRNPLPVLSCTETTESQTIHQSNGDCDYVEADVYDVSADEEIGSGICAVPKKRTSRSKTRIRKNVWKRKAYFAALKAYSLAKSISTGNSKSFLVVDKKKSSE
ncbi:Ribosomal_L32p domain-containing protein [Cephalotus follicularis]|uniref:Large ribosomal subunit protein bL32c n=1 Tax=Cephalotus follicularis TaxID=3775 RepID=A0A1Q3AQV2_CEPFO|nr:Ribosomal_L32p domain-containing protein [Cephalotus follicularis]